MRIIVFGFRPRTKQVTLYNLFDSFSTFHCRCDLWKVAFSFICMVFIIAKKKALRDLCYGYGSVNEVITLDEKFH